MYIALKELGKLVQRDDRQVTRRLAIVVLSDAEDTSSFVSFDEVLDLASRSDTAIDTIGPGGAEPRTGGNALDGHFVLRRLAQQTGGRAFFPRQVKELSGVYGSIRTELPSQYSLAYDSSGGRRDGQWRRIAVRVNVRVSRPGSTCARERATWLPLPNAD